MHEMPILMTRRARPHILVSIIVGVLCLPVVAKSAAAQDTFDTASVKRAKEDAPTSGTAFMISLAKQSSPRGLLTMTAPLAPLIMFAYDVQDEVEARAFRSRLPEWAQREKFTIIARPPQDAPTQEQIRLMMRSLLEDRFALKVHRANHSGPVKLLTLAKAGITGPRLKPHDAAKVCLRRQSSGPQPSPDKGTPAPIFCGLELHEAGGASFT
jgi:uncharacterized protein (TIGR03435 family)